MQARWSAYAGVSVALAGGVVVKALAQRPNFYSAAVYLSQSSANLMASTKNRKLGQGNANLAAQILTNMVFVVACSLLLGLQKLLYGPLRPIEIEHLYEKAWFAVTETCLAMTIFRGEIGSWFLVMFFSLLAGKVWAWIGEGRVEILEQQPPRDPRLFHTRLALSLGLSVVFNLSMLEFVVTEVMHMPKPDMMVMFGFEFAVLSIISLSTAARYAINLVEIGIVRKQKAQRVEFIKLERRNAAVRQVLDRAIVTQTSSDTVEIRSGQAPSLTEEAMDAGRAADQQPVDEAEIEVEGWEGKGRWMFYLDLATDFFKLVVYLSFFFILLAFYGLPIHILRDVFLTCRSFIKRISDFIKYRNATRDMNERYPDASAQDFGHEDVCIICREEMRPYEPPAAGHPPNPVAERMRPKKLPCGHVLHFSCLRSWLERQQICPTCRTSVVPATQDATTGNGMGGGQGGRGGQQAAGRGRGGVLRIGPLRIAMGAMRGNNIVNDLQQRLRDNEPQPPPAQADVNAPQQLGFGIRWEGLRRRERRDRTPRTIQDQLQSLERQIQQESNALDASMTELQLLRSMEAQLTLLRRSRQATTGARQPLQAGSGTTGDVPAQPRFVSNPAAQLSSGHPNLPAGLTLPEGWTMTPLVATHPPASIPPLHAPMTGAGTPFMPNPTFATQNRGMPTGFQLPTSFMGPHDAQQSDSTASQSSGQSESQHRQSTPTGADAAGTRSLAELMAEIAESRAHGQPSTQAEDQSPSAVLANGSSTAHDTRAMDHDREQYHPDAVPSEVSTSSSTTPTPLEWGPHLWNTSQSSQTIVSSSRATEESDHAPTNIADNASQRASIVGNDHPARLEERRDRNPTVEDPVDDPD